MKTAVVNLLDGSFLAKNNRWYKLARSVRKAPSPKVFESKAKAVAWTTFARKEIVTDCNFVSPEKIKQKEPRKASIRTCGGRSSR